MRKKVLIIPTLMVLALVAMVTLSSSSVLAAPPDECTENSTRVPGHCDKNTGTVVGHYYSVYAYDALGDWYWDLGDGRIQGTVGSIDALDSTTLTTCYYVINYRGDFGGDPFLDVGVIQNIIRCNGYDDNAVYMYLIVHQSSPLYTGNGIPAFGGTWEYHNLVISGYGDITKGP